MLKKTLFILLSSTIFSVHATPDFLSYKNCSPLNLSDANFSLSSKDVFPEYSYITKNYNFLTLPISDQDQRYCLIINNKNKVIVDAIPTMLSGMCAGKWDKQKDLPIWEADVGGGRGTVVYMNYSTSQNLKKLKKSEKLEIDEIIKSINCQLPVYSKNDVQELNDSAFYLYKLGYYNESLSILNHVVKLDPSRAVAYLNIADIYVAQKNELLARKNYAIYYAEMKKLGLLSEVPNRIKKYL